MWALVSQYYAVVHSFREDAACDTGVFQSVLDVALNHPPTLEGIAHEPLEVEHP